MIFVTLRYYLPFYSPDGDTDCKASCVSLCGIVTDRTGARCVITGRETAKSPLGVFYAAMRSQLSFSL